MTKSNRKVKWKGIKLNESNVDEYIQDLYNDTKNQHIIQAISFNKDDKLEMSIYKNVLLSQGSFGGFIKTLLRKYFEQQGKLDDDSIWLPNVDMIDMGAKTVDIPFTTPKTTPEPTTTPPPTSVGAEVTAQQQEQQKLQLNSDEENPPANKVEKPTDTPNNDDIPKETHETTSSNDEVSATTQEETPKVTPKNEEKPKVTPKETPKVTPRKTTPNGNYRKTPKKNAFTQPPKAE